jgi:hypothetical protein
MLFPNPIHHLRDRGTPAIDQILPPGIIPIPDRQSPLKTFQSAVATVLGRQGFNFGHLVPCLQK